VNNPPRGTLALTPQSWRLFAVCDSLQVLEWDLAFEVILRSRCLPVCEPEAAASTLMTSSGERGFGQD
jgi:hypothetical protein